MTVFVTNHFPEHVTSPEHEGGTGCGVPIWASFCTVMPTVSAAYQGVPTRQTDCGEIVLQITVLFYNIYSRDVSQLKIREFAIESPSLDTPQHTPPSDGGLKRDY